MSTNLVSRFLLTHPDLTFSDFSEVQKNTEMRGGLSRTELVGEMRSRLKREVEGGASREWLNELTMAYWYHSFPVIDYDDPSKFNINAIQSHGPFWIYNRSYSSLFSYPAEWSSQEETTWVGYEPVVGREVGTFLFFLYEFSFCGRRWLMPRLRRQASFVGVSMVNVFPVLACDAWGGYDEYVNSVTRTDVERMLPYGLELIGE